MMTQQKIFLIILGALTIIGYFGAAINDKPEKRISYVILLTIICGIFSLTTIILFEEINDYKKQANNCPEYEQINVSVYKLK